MTDRDFRLPAMAALAAAIGLPLLWLQDLVRVGLTGRHPLDGGPSFADLLFLALGLAAAWAYLALRDYLRERLSYRTLDIPLLVLVGLTLLFHFGLFFIALTGWFLDGDVVTVLAMAFWLPLLVLFGLVDIVIAVLLLRDRAQLPALFTLLGALSLILGIMELTVIFSFTAVVLLPLLLLVVALCLVHRPDWLEVV